MVYKFRAENILIIAVFCVLSFIRSCVDKIPMNTDNTYYVELVNCKDSLQPFLMAAFSGKTAYYKNKELQIVSLNFVKDGFKDMHYFKSVDGLQEPIETGTRKIRIEIAGDYTIDSTSYSIQKLVFRNNTWNIYSDVGFINYVSNDQTARTRQTPIIYSVLRKQILYNAVAGTYN